MYLSRFDGQSRLLVRSLMCGESGAHRAVSVYHRQHRLTPETSLENLIETLCQEEVSAEGEVLAVKPLVCLFPALFKQNLLSFIYLLHPAIPATSILHLLKCLSRDTRPNAWVTALTKQLERSLAVSHTQPLYSAECSRRVKELSQHVAGSGEAGGWTMCFGGDTELDAQSNELGLRRKRKCEVIVLDSDDEDVSQQTKRIKTDVSEIVSNIAADPIPKTDSKGLETDTPMENLTADIRSDALPEHIKVSALQMKELFENHTEWDQNSADVFRVLNDCDPHQVELLCKMLSLSDLPEQTLPKLCSSILAVSPDLSYSTAATLIKSFLLEKVILLSEPASRCLVTAVTTLCGHYPRPICQALIGPVLEEKNIGPPQAELLSRLIESCLDSHFRLLVLQMTLKISWSEPVLTVIHCILDSKPDLNEELFTQFAEQLVSQGPLFTKSVKFAKMMLTVLTKYSSHITPEHKHSLSACLVLNESFLKKSLQAALKRITHF